MCATEIAGVAIEGVLKQCGLEGKNVDEAFIGNVLSANLGQVPDLLRFPDSFEPLRPRQSRHV